MDSQATTIENGTHADAHGSELLHHFDTPEQQRDASSFGMWIFLATEVMFFGGLFASYLLYRNWYYPAFVAASKTGNLVLGTTNTAVLIGSSLTMAMAVWSAQMRYRRLLCLFLIATMALGATFLGIKAVEYHAKWVEHHVPGLNFNPEEFTHTQPDGDPALSLDMAEKTQIYFSLYFAMTGMHALHMIIGMGIMCFLLLWAWQGNYTTGHYTMIENFGLYWHFVDIIWIYLFPLLYLISRHR